MQHILSYSGAWFMVGSFAELSLEVGFTSTVYLPLTFFGVVESSLLSKHEPLTPNID